VVAGVAAVINLSGATESPLVIEAGNAPLCSAHGTADATVPYLQGKIGSLLPPKYVYGSGRLNARATALGITNVLRRFSKADHVPFETNSLYADTTFWTVRDFLRPLLRRTGVALAAKTSVAAATIQAYPNPAQEAVRLILPANWAQLGEAEVLDAAGRVVRRFRPQAQAVQLVRGELAAGLYAVRFAGQAPVRVVFE
ncbi:MAG: T9SS type A sorting domain-containing protein, partial [Cytophagaceae bacterium]